MYKDTKGKSNPGFITINLFLFLFNFKKTLHTSEFLSPFTTGEKSSQTFFILSSLLAGFITVVILSLLLVGFITVVILSSLLAGFITVGIWKTIRIWTDLDL